MAKKKVAPKEETKEEEVIIPEIGKEGWQEYVMSQFNSDELEEGRPKVDALYRVCEELVGEVISIRPNVRQSPNPDNGNCAVVECDIEVLLNGTHSERCYGGVADASTENIPSYKYQKYPTAIADTRAFGRALKRALKLRNIVSAEEISGADGDTKIDDKSGPISKEQISYLDVMCDNKYNVNVVSLLKECIPDFTTIDKVTEEQVQGVFKHLRELSDSIPENLQGYDANWLKEVQ